MEATAALEIRPSGRANVLMIPAIVQRMIDVIGWDDAISLVMRWGGTTVYIPDTEDGAMHSQISRVIGQEKAVALGKKIGGGQLQMPKCALLLTQQRDVEIMQRRASGETVRDLALRFRLTERHVYRILSETDDEV